MDGYHLDPEDFRRTAHQVVDWCADLMARVPDLPVRSTVEPGWVRSQLPPHPPERPEPFADVLADLDRVVLPGITHWQSPGWFAYYPANSSGPSVLGELVSAVLGVQGMLWSTSPACTELETHVLDWLVELCGLPACFRSDGRGGGVIEDSASSAVLCALVAARERAREAHPGVPLERLVAYGSSQTHSSLEKGARIAGYGHVRAVDVDEVHALDPAALEAAIAADRAAGLVPTFVCATLGTTSSAAVDPVPAVADLAGLHGLWLHVDAAHAGSAFVCVEFRWMLAGVERADSYCFNPHKWLFTNFDCSAFYVADRAALVRALSVLPEYLRNEATESGRVIDYRDWQIPLGRRFRALKLWFVLRHYGAEGLRFHVREHVEAAHRLATRLRFDPRFEVVAPVSLALVCFRHVDGDDATRVLLERLNATGRVLLTHTVLDGRFVIRASVGARATERRHVEQLGELIGSLA